MTFLQGEAEYFLTNFEVYFLDVSLVAPFYI